MSVRTYRRTPLCGLYDADNLLLCKVNRKHPAVDAVVDRLTAVPALIDALKAAHAEISSLREAMFKTYCAAANGGGLSTLRARIESDRDVYESVYSSGQIEEALAAAGESP